MQGYIYLIGGGEIANGETKDIDNNIKQNITKKSSFVFFGTAASDSIGYIDTIQSVFGDRFDVIAATEEKGREFAVDAINNASVVYLGGGATEPLLGLFEKWKLVDFLQKALKRGTSIAGMSAGAQALSAYYIDEDARIMSIKQGWGVAPVCSLMHARENLVQEALTLYRQNREVAVNPFVAIGEKAAWCLTGSKGQKIGQGPVWYAKGGSLDTLIHF